MLYILLYCEFNLSVIEYHVINEKMHFYINHKKIIYIMHGL